MKKNELTKKEIIHLAKLSNLFLTNEEIKKFQRQLSEVVDYFTKLDELDTKNIEPVSQITGLTNVYKNDEASPLRSLTTDEALQNSVKKKGNYFQVKAIFNQ